MELIFTVIVAAVLLAVAASTFRGFAERNRIAAAANELVAGIMFARSAAVTRNRPAALCHSSDGASCGGTWGNGWLVFEDADGDGLLDTGEEVLRTREGLRGTLGVTGPTGAIVFSPTGQLVSPSPPVDLVIKESGITKRCVRIGETGRPRLSEGGCI